MASRLTNQVRIEQTRSELDHLQKEIGDWLENCRKKDKLQQYHTQLNVLEKALDGSLGGLRSALDSVADDQLSGEVYASCRAYDKRLVLVQRVWAYFRSKFDQRDDPYLKQVLAAADEVVWSCYAEVFKNASFHSQREVSRGPAPLPYIEPQYSPQAIPRDEPPPDLKSDNNDDLLYEYLKRLPIPIVSLPPVCAEEPWWLIYLGHEVGHHLQYDLMPNLGLIDNFGQLLQETALSDPDPKCDAGGAQRWRSWGKEIFADICSVCSMGPWAVRAMVELELADDRTMLKRNKPRYPSSVVRLDLLAHVADVLGLDGRAALGGNVQLEKLVNGPPLMEDNRDLRQAIAEDLKMIPKIVDIVMKKSLVDLGRFKDFYDWNVADFRPGGSVYNWAQDLRNPANLYPEKSLRAARMLISGAVAAWTEVAAIDDATKRQEAREQLAKSLLPVLAESREEGTRATEPIAEPEITNLGDQLTQMLLQTIPDHGEL